jgi:hypothetical protein
VSFFQFLTMLNTNVGAGAASRYGCGSEQMMRLRLRNTDATLGEYDVFIIISTSIKFSQHERHGSQLSEQKTEQG